MKVSIITPLRNMEYDVAWLELNTSVGNFVIQTGHAPTLLLLSPNSEVVFRLKNGKQETLMALNGIAEITREASTVIMQEKV